MAILEEFIVFRLVKKFSNIINRKVHYGVHKIPQMHVIFFSAAQQPAIGPRPPYWVPKSI
jgi:hypothetical protein